MKWPAVAAALVSTATITVSVASAIPGSSATNVIHRCTTAELRIKVFHTGAAAGTVGGYVGFTNTASRACRLSGWPKLVAVEATGATTTAVRRRSTMFGPRPTIKGIPLVPLGSEERADAVFTAGDNPGPGETRCRPSYRQLRVSPPGHDRSVLLSAWLPGLGAYLPAYTRIQVSFVVPASALYRG